jgi:hypothetical protein
MVGRIWMENESVIHSEIFNMCDFTNQKIVQRLEQCVLEQLFDTVLAVEVEI